MTEGNGLRADLQRSLRNLSRWTVVLFLAVILVAGAGLYNSYQQRQALRHEVVRITTSLCTFVADLQRRHDDGVQFLEDHPDGIPGISAKDIQRSIDAQQSTLDALSGLDCR